MYIERIQVEDGFLDGLDLRLKPGLNVLIGARGTGKTSIIELVRFCFGITGQTPDSTKRSREHATSILGAGQVTVTLRNGSTVFTFSRAANESPKRDNPAVRNPIIFSQTEIEAVGLLPGGRLGLIDAFDIPRIDDRERAVTADALSITSQISGIRHEIEQLQAALTELPALTKELNQLKPAEDNLSHVSAAASQKTDALNALTDQLSTLAIADAAVERFAEYVERLHSALAALPALRTTIEAWPPNAGRDPLLAERAEVVEIQANLRLQLEKLTNISRRSVAAAEALTGKRMPLEAQGRVFRKEIESLQVGAGEISRQGQQLRERIAQVESLKQVAETKLAALSDLTSKRNHLLEMLSDLRAKKSESRQTIAASLNKSLGPRIRVSIETSGQYQVYSALVAEVLKGSGLRYNEIAPLVARAISPRELLEAAENDDFALICEATGMSRDRALRLLSALRSTDLGRVGTVSLDDEVTLSLLDGKDFKSIEELSTGQRCTVVLPIVLRHVDRVLIVDQPEDHIDNAFITETLIKAVLERDPKGQIIFSTHNANVPVLGSANHVVQMGSDGHRGFPMVEGDLDSPAVVSAISTVMEGGADAFRRRAAFYRAHQNDA